jgi:hypothetical protein
MTSSDQRSPWRCATTHAIAVACILFLLGGVGFSLSRTRAQSSNQTVEKSAEATASATDGFCQKYSKRLSLQQSEGTPLSEATEESSDETKQLIAGCLLDKNGYMQPVDGETQVLVDVVSGFICAKTQKNGGAGGSCTSTDATQPMVLITQGTSDEPVHLVVVDPERRLGSIAVIVGSDRKTFDAIQDEGLWVEAEVPSMPDTLLVLSEGGQELAVYQPKEDADRVNQAEQKVVDDGPGEGE